MSLSGFRDGLIWATVAETGRDVPPDPPDQYVDVDFDTQVYPLFLPVNQGGFGCQGCHTDQGGVVPAAGMNLYGADNAYNALNPQTYPTRVNLQNPTASYLLVRPLYEAGGVQDHPIFAFTSPADAGYQIILAWITEGAQRNLVAPLQVSFYNDVYPLLYGDPAQGAAGCSDARCHGLTPNGSGGLYIVGDANALYDELTNEAPTDNGGSGEPYRINKNGNTGLSLLLTNPLTGSNEPHPVKLFFGADDPRYQILYQWISLGYVNDAPP